MNAEKTIQKLTSWLRQKIEEAGAKGAIVGVSGGIDSAVVAHLIKRAFPEDSLGVIMPCKSNPDDQEHALKVIESADLDHITIDLSDTHEIMIQQMKQQLGQNWDQERAALGDGNLKARLRMSTLYTVAHQYRYLVIGTDNAAEWYTGYFTKYGDGGVDLVPLVHLTKGEVAELAKALNVPDVVINKKPSAGLWEGQTDEEEMGTTYNKIDAYLKGESVPEKDKTTIERMHKTSEHKRQLAASPPNK